MFRPSDTPNCESTDVESFFVPDGQGTYPEIKALKSICNNCVVQKECLDFAVENNIKSGIWAGTTPLQRKALRREYRDTNRI